MQEDARGRIQKLVGYDKRPLIFHVSIRSSRPKDASHVFNSSTIQNVSAVRAVSKWHPHMHSHNLKDIHGHQPARWPHTGNTNIQPQCKPSHLNSHRFLFTLLAQLNTNKLCPLSDQRPRRGKAAHTDTHGHRLPSPCHPSTITATTSSSNSILGCPP